MSTLTIPVQTKQTLTGTYAKSGNDLYFISEEPDLFPPNPRTDWDCYSTFYIAPNRYFSGDIPVSAFVPDVKAGIEPEYVKLPIYAYVHSAIALSTTPFHDDFDSGLAGFAVCTRQDVADLGYSTPDWRSHAENVINSELELYQQYLNGEAKALTLYQYNPDSNEWEVNGSCGGCYNIESDQDMVDVFFSNATALDHPDFES